MMWVWRHIHAFWRGRSLLRALERNARAADALDEAVKALFKS